MGSEVDFREPLEPRSVSIGSGGRDRRPAPAGASSDSEARYEAHPNGVPTPLPVRPENAPAPGGGAQPGPEASAPGVGGVPASGDDPSPEDRQDAGRPADAGGTAPDLTAENEGADSFPLYPSLAGDLRDAYLAFPAAGPPASQAAARRAEARGTLVRLLVRYALARGEDAQEVRKAA